jgi:glutathione synthase/RimK-type ligase-like ATP-grasp enzyme
MSTQAGIETEVFHDSASTVALHSHTRRIAFVTYERDSSLQPDDALAAALLEQDGVTVIPVAWNDDAADWNGFDGIIVRSAWDYHLAPGRFAAWLDAREKSGVPVSNPPALMRWNMDKRYLAELGERGVPIVPTHWVDCSLTLREILALEGWTRAVVKPRISASAFETWTTSLERARADEPRFVRERAARALMVQRYEPAIESSGEWSLVFIAGEYSHAVRKRPAPGDFRVQQEWGGTVVSARAPEHVLAGARMVAGNIPGDWLYARVDGCDAGHAFLLMELELIEPTLFLAHAGASRRFAHAVQQWIERAAGLER